MNRTPDEIIASIEMCATSGVGNLLIGDNEMARLVLAWREKDAEIERLRAALGKIAAIENNDWGGDWEEIDQAREIARAALSPSRPNITNKQERDSD